MKRVHNLTDINHKQGQELTKKLYRSISEQAKLLDDARSCARSVGDLFTPNLIVQRKKFCEYCERLIFLDTALYGKKGEELLWRKGCYDVVSTAKRLKNKEYLPHEITSIQAHINAGIGYFHHLLLRIQQEFNLDLKNIIDFALDYEPKKTSPTNLKPEAIDWAKQSIHQCLIYLGDLSRYKLDIYPNWEPNLAIRYYLQAISYLPDHGMPHNQMGTLEMNQNHNLEAVYHYIRCLSCRFPFEGTTNNLHSLFEKNSKYIEELPNEDNNTDCIIEIEKSENIKRFLARFLLLIDIWYFNKKVTKVYNLCHQIYKNLEECLSYRKTTISESEESPIDSESSETDSCSYMCSSRIFKVVVICLMCISKLREINSPQLSTAVAFTLAIYSQLIQNITNHIQESVLNYPTNENLKLVKSHKPNGILKDLMYNGKKRSKSMLRRRKIVKLESEDESDASENNDDQYSSSDDSFISDSEDVLAISSDEELDIIKVSNDEPSKQSQENVISNGVQLPDSPNKSKEDIIKKVQQMDVNDMLEIITEETTLQSIKVLNDWLKNESDILKSCGLNNKTVVVQIIYLLNLININLTNPKLLGINIKLSDIIFKEGKIPLSEDVLLKGVQMLQNSHSSLDWNYIKSKGLNMKEEAVVRIVKLLCFGKHLMNVEEAGVSYNEDNNIFVCRDIDESNPVDAKLSAALLEELELNELNATSITIKKNSGATPGKSSPNKIHADQSNKNVVGQRLTKMWLASEVRSLESRFGTEGGGLGGKVTLSPYLVVDADALIRYTYAVKQLVHSRKFVVLVPTAVVSALDDLKREKIEAREAIRWLESQFHRGNRFFRAQRPQEKLTIPFIKYPKKRDKEMLIYIQIIECCHFLAEQQKDASNVVTLLIGNQNVLSNGENKEFSYVGLAQSIGIAIEQVNTFYAKWKKCRGKR